MVLCMIQRKFVRTSESVPATNFYGAFREWLDATFPVLNDGSWSEILQEDDSVDYSTVGNGMPEFYDIPIEGEEVVRSDECGEESNTD